MQTFEIQSLPRVRFAHIHHSEKYVNAFPVREGCMEVSFISEGSLTVIRDGKEYLAKKGDVICLPYFPHEISIRADGYHEHRTVLADLAWSEQSNPNGLYLPIITPAQQGTRAAENIIEQLIRDRILLKGSPTKCASLFLDLLCEIDRCNRSLKSLKIPSEALYTQRAKEYVQSHIRQPIAQKDVAAQLSITPEYLCTVFKKTEGITFKKYVNTEKLEAIRTLVEKEHFRLYEAAAAFGYSDPNYVSRLFKKYYGYCLTEKGSFK